MNVTGPHLLILGIAQDAGYPQAGCRRDCCRLAWANPELRRTPACVALVDPASGARWMIDATPAFPEQLRRLDQHCETIMGGEAPHDDQGTSGRRPVSRLDGILLTHAHIGHYTGLMYLGREAIGAARMPVYAMPRMADFLARHAPWEQLVRLEQIELRPLVADAPLRLGPSDVEVIPRLVPHRGEYSETVAFEIHGPRQRVLYLPDIDRWKDADDLAHWIAGMDVAYLDGTFFSAAEIPGRNLAEVPHPLITTTLSLLNDLPENHGRRVRFLHLNHTNPALQIDSPERRAIAAAGCHVADEGEVVAL